MQAGDLDRCIQILRKQPAFDDVGKPIKDSPEILLFKAWAKYKPVSDREKLSHKLQANLTARFTIRWTCDHAKLEASDILVFQEKRFGIFGFRELGRKEYIEITAGAYET